MDKKIKIISFIISAVAFAAMQLLPVYAQTTGGIGGGLNSIQGNFQTGGAVGGAQTVGQLIRAIILILLYFAGTIAILFIIYGGYLYISSQGNEEQTEKGRRVLTNAIIGLAIIGFSYVLVNVAANFIRGSVN